MTFAECLGLIAPWYNLVLVILVLVLFRKLFSIHYNIHHIKTFTLPWRLVMAAVLVFVVEEVFTVLRQANIFHLPLYFNGLFEMLIISLFLYTLFIEREHILVVYGK